MFQLLRTRVLTSTLATSLLLTQLTGCKQETENPTEQGAVTEHQAANTEVQPGSKASGTNAPATNDAMYAGIPLTITSVNDSSYDGGMTVGVRFSAPLSSNQPFQNFVHISGESPAWILSDDGLTLYMADPEPERTYKIIVSKGLKARNGSVLESGDSATVTLPPAPPSATFASGGHYLTTDLSVGLPVNVMNANEVNVSFFRVRNSDESLRQMLLWKSSDTQEHVYQLEDLNEFSDFVYDGRIALTTDKNRLRQVNLPLASIDALKEQAVYVAVMTIPGKFTSKISTTWFTVSDIGLHIRDYPKKIGIFTRDLNTGTSKADVALTIMRGYRSQEPKITEFSSGKNGYVEHQQTDFYNSVLIARSGAAVTMMHLNSTALDMSEFDTGTRPYRTAELFMYGPRDLYRGGDTVYINGLYRNDDGKAQPDTLLTYYLRRPDGTRSDKVTWRSTVPGVYEFSTTLANDAPTGQWSFNVREPSGDTHTYNFQVEDFMPERMKLEWNPEQRPQVFTTQETPEINLLGSYLYGAPAAGNAFEADFSLRPNAHPFSNWAEFHFGDPKQDDWIQVLPSQQTKLNDAGKLTLNAENTWKDTRIPLALRVTGSLFESGGRPVVRSHTVSIVPEGQLVGIRPLFTDEAATNAPASFELISTDSTGALVSSNSLEMTLTNITLETRWKRDDNRGWYYEEQRRNVRELSLPVVTKADSPITVQVPVQWGEYVLQVRDTNTGLISRFYFKAGKYWFWQSRDQAARPDQVTLAFDKESYDAGDNARLKITPPAAGHSLILIESDELLFRTEADIPAEGGWVDIPVSKKWQRHDIYVSVIHLQPSDTQQRITPTRSVGLIHLPLNRENQRLNIEIETPEKWLPESTEEVALNITSAEPVSRAWVTLAAVDSGILSISRFKTPDPFAFFFGQRRFSVDAKDMYGKLIDLNNNRTGEIRYGGDADLARGGDLARSEVQIISLFSGMVNVENGKAVIPVSMPDFNGQIRLMALAFDKQRLGSTDTKVTVAAPVVTQLSLPRFIGAGDESSVALDVTNLTGDDAEFEVTLSASGPVSAETLAQPLSQTLSLKQQQRETLILPFKAENAGRVVFHSIVKYQDKVIIDREWGLQSRQPYPALTFRKYDVLETGALLRADAEKTSDWLQDSLVASVSISSYEELGAEERMERLLKYPYGCVEQTTSSTYPWLYASDEQIERLKHSANGELTRTSAIASGLARIATRQKSNGGFGLWRREDDDEQHWLAAYVAQFMTDAQAAGYQIDNDMLSKTLNRLREYSRGKAQLRELWAEDVDLYRFTYQAFAHFVLAQHNIASLADIRATAANAPDEAGGLALLQLAIAAKLQGDNRLATELYEKSQTPRQTRPYISDYGSELRDKAQQARLIWKYDLDSAHPVELTTEIAEQLRSRRYLSTQEQIAIVQLADEQKKHTSEDWKLMVLSAGKEQMLTGNHPSRIVLRGSDAADLSVTNIGDANLYTNLFYQGYSSTPPDEDTSGQVSVSRRYWNLDGNKLPADQAITMITGDMMIVELVVYSNKYRPDLLMVDLLPAGLEIENQNLADSTKLTDVVIDGEKIGQRLQSSGVVHEEFRDDRYVAALRTGPRRYYNNDHDRPAHMYYIVRAVTPGTYKVPNPLLEDMYDPEVRAIGSTIPELIVLPR
ncbi:alpha-2-macroglobulin [uncultured Thalassolituus sp.]|uniref:alpha-2-macroglobulin family protein n=1 Tax=uncultured Thalassolituus sp. TaxID=285273 RepID=UPI002621B203|nr:alpha-2-macroglobulin [uncultured Thalassolituus sp.]